MAKKKAKRPANDGDWTLRRFQLKAPDAVTHFNEEVAQLLERVPAHIWEDTSICGLMYDFIPWHSHSSLAIQCQGENANDSANWRYYDCSDSDCTLIESEIALYEQTQDNRVLHWLLVSAAEALLKTDLQPYGIEQTTESGFLYGPFRLQVYDVDESFRFNYCEHVLANRFA